MTHLYDPERPPEVSLQLAREIRGKSSRECSARGVQRGCVGQAALRAAMSLAAVNQPYDVV